jgi:hypothetical protein
VDNLPQPADRRSLRVSDADRDQVAAVLRQAAVDGRLTPAELDERLGLAFAATTYADLEVITSDLPGTAPVSSAGADFPADRIGGHPSGTFSLAFMGGARRRGRWTLPRRYTALAVMGGVELDLRDARFTEREVTIQTYCLMGGVQIIVPDDIEVDVSGFAFMGGFDHRASGPGLPGAPLVRVVGFALMGGVEVKRRPARPPGRLTPSGEIEPRDGPVPGK